MKEPIQKIFILAIGVAIVSSAGCQEQGLSSEKKSRLIAAENVQLKKEIEQHDKEIEKLKKLHDEEIERQEELLTRCLQEKESWKQKAQQNIKEQVDSVLAAVVDDNAKLREEIKNLKAQIEKLKTEAPELGAKGRQSEEP